MNLFKFILLLVWTALSFGAANLVIMVLGGYESLFALAIGAIVGAFLLIAVPLAVMK